MLRNFLTLILGLGVSLSAASTFANIVSSGTIKEDVVSRQLQDDGSTVIISKVATPDSFKNSAYVAMRLDQAQRDRDNFDGTEIDEATIIFDKMINLGQKVWKIIADNAPVVDIRYNYANALPQGVTSSSALTGFSDLQYDTWRYRTKNRLGVTTIDIMYSVVHQFGGSLNGRGQYLETVAVVPQRVNVAWGYHVDLNVNQISTTNVGTELAPVAAMVMELTLHSKTVLFDSTIKGIYQVRGDSAEVLAVE